MSYRNSIDIGITADREQTPEVQTLVDGMVGTRAVAGRSPRRRSETRPCSGRWRGATSETGWAGTELARLARDLLEPGLLEVEDALGPVDHLGAVGADPPVMQHPVALGPRALPDAGRCTAAGPGQDPPKTPRAALTDQAVAFDPLDHPGLKRPPRPDDRAPQDRQRDPLIMSPYSLRIRSGSSPRPGSG